LIFNVFKFFTNIKNWKNIGDVYPVSISTQFKFFDSVNNLNLEFRDVTSKPKKERK